MKKRRILLISLFVLLGMIIFNFWINSAYYAVHSKYTSQDEVPGVIIDPVSYTHLTLPTKEDECRSRWSPYH